MRLNRLNLPVVVRAILPAGAVQPVATTLSAGLCYPSGTGRFQMIATALDRIAMPPVATLLGWHLLDARPGEGWIRIGFEGKPEFCNPAASCRAASSPPCSTTPWVP